MGLHQDRKNAEVPGLSDWAIPIIITVISGAIAISGDAGRELLKFDRLAIDAGEYWRLLSGHFAHLTALHLAMNLAGLWLVWFLVGSRGSLLAWLAVIALIVAGIDAGFWILNPNLLWYVGLSGLLHGLIVAGAVAGLGHERIESIVILAGVFGKVIYEQVGGAVPGTEFLSGGPVVTDAHMYGAITGIATGLLLWRRVPR
jgi:rhomboid family GlyGly-CTERM serine protease